MMMAEGKSGQKRAAKQNIVELHFLITYSENCQLFVNLRSAKIDLDW